MSDEERRIDDSIFQNLAESYPMYIAWTLGLRTLWAEVENDILKQPVRFLTEQQRKAMLP